MAIIKSYKNIRLFQRHYEGPAAQKNWARPQAQNEWVLLMDADERITPAMQNEITEILRGDQTANPLGNSTNGQAFNCYWIGFTHYFRNQQ